MPVGTLAQVQQSVGRAALAPQAPPKVPTGLRSKLLAGLVAFVAVGCAGELGQGAATSGASLADTTLSPVTPGQDDREQIQRAIDAAVSAGGGTVTLNAGTYHLRSVHPSVPAHLAFQGGTGVTLRGVSLGSVKLLMYNATKAGISIDSSRDPQITELTIDWQPKLAGQGTVVAIEGDMNLVWVANDPGYPQWDDALFQNRYPQFLTRGARGATPPRCDLMKDTSWGPAFGYTHGYNWFHATSLSCMDGLHVGDRVILANVNYDAPGILLAHIRGLSIRNVTLHAAPGQAILNYFSDRGTVFPTLDVVNFNLVHNPSDPSRLFTTPSDGIHSIASRAAWNITNSTFEGMCDDGINIHARTGYFRSFTPYEGNQVLTFASTPGWGHWKSGDFVEVYSPLAHRMDCGVTLLTDPWYAGEYLGETYYQVLTTRNLYWSCNQMVPYDGSNRSAADQVVSVTQLYDAVSSGGNVVSGNTFRGHRGHAFRNRGYHTVITNNDFGIPGNAPSMGGIREGYCTDEAAWAEGMLITPSLDPTQLVSGNRGLWNNTIVGCL